MKQPDLAEHPFTETTSHKEYRIMKSGTIPTLLTGSALTLCIATSPATAANIALFNFENYPAGSTGNTALLDTDPDPRVYDVNSSLLTGITSVSPISFASFSLTSGQNKVESGSSGGSGDDLRVYRWRSTSSGLATASFSVEVASGYAIENFSLSFLQGNGNYAGTFDVSYDNGSGPIVIGPQGTLNGSGYNLYTSNTIASQVTGTVDFVVTFTATNDVRTGRFDDFTLTGDVVVVPETSTFALLGLAGIGMLARRRR